MGAAWTRDHQGELPFLMYCAAGMAARQARGEQDAQLPTLVRIPTATTAAATAAAASSANKATDDPSHNE